MTHVVHPRGSRPTAFLASPPRQARPTLPDVDSAIGPVDRLDRFIILPRWKPRSALPSRMFEYPGGKRAGQLNTDLAAAYDRGAAGRPVMDTLLDAYKFLRHVRPGVGQARGQRPAHRVPDAATAPRDAIPTAASGLDQQSRLGRQSPKAGHGRRPDRLRTRDIWTAP